MSFRTLNPATPFCAAWYGDLLAHYAQQVIDGELKRLIVNLPPKTGKSTKFSVVLPAHMLSKAPTRRIICASYSDQMATKLHNDCRSILHAPWRTEPSANWILSRTLRPRPPRLPAVSGSPPP